MNTTCENCGLPSGSVKGDGVSLVIEATPENRFQRTRRRTVWCHSEECAIQCLAIAKYGLATHKWPITLAQFRATKPLSQQSTPRSGRQRASRVAKDAVWAMATAKSGSGSNAESIA